MSRIAPYGFGHEGGVNTYTVKAEIWEVQVGFDGEIADVHEKTLCTASFSSVMEAVELGKQWKRILHNSKTAGATS